MDFRPIYLTTVTSNIFSGTTRLMSYWYYYHLGIEMRISIFCCFLRWSLLILG